MEEELKILAEMVDEIAKKYDIYLTTTSFYGKGVNVTYQAKDDENFKSLGVDF